MIQPETHPAFLSVGQNREAYDFIRANFENIGNLVLSVITEGKGRFSHVSHTSIAYASQVQLTVDDATSHTIPLLIEIKDNGVLQITLHPSQSFPYNSHYLKKSGDSYQVIPLTKKQQSASSFQDITSYLNSGLQEALHAEHIQFS